jgi:hypothetical protein
MTDKTITQLTATTSAVGADEIPMWVAGSGVTRKITRANFIGATLTGAGTIATGGFALTVPATGTAALRGAANTFTRGQVIDTTDTIPLSVQLSSVERVNVTQTAALSQIQQTDFDNGSSFGPRIIVGRNSNASTPAAGHLRLTNVGNTSYRIWPDTSGNLRIGTSDPTNANDTSGTVVGAQTSSLDAKTVLGAPADIADVLAAVQAGAEAVRRFTYRSGAFNGEEFSGVVVDYAPRYGMDRDGEHPAGKALNVVTAIGDLLIPVDGTGLLIATTGSPEIEPFMCLETASDVVAAGTLLHCIFTGY